MWTDSRSPSTTWMMTAWCTGVLTVSLDDDHGVAFVITAADVAVGVGAGLILFVCTVSVTRN